MGHEQSANAIEEDGWIFALDHEHEELCELIMIDSWCETIVDGIRSGNETARNEAGEL